MKLSLAFRLWVAYQAIIHGKYLVDRPVNMQIIIPGECHFTDEEIGKICSGVHDEIVRVVNEINARDAQ